MLRNRGHVPKTRGHSSDLLYFISQHLLILMTTPISLTHSLSLVTLHSFCFPPISMLILLSILWRQDSSLSLLQCHFLRASEFSPIGPFFKNEKNCAWLISSLSYGFNYYVLMTLKALSLEQRIPEFVSQITTAFWTLP